MSKILKGSLQKSQYLNLDTSYELFTYSFYYIVTVNVCVQFNEIFKYKSNNFKCYH